MKKKLKKYLKNKIKELYENRIGYYFFKQKGYCLCCDSKVEFIAHKPWLRDHFLCSNCGCKPRERALMKVIEQEYPNWKELKIHESSPIKRGHSLKIKKGNKNNYLASQYYVNEPLGKVINGFRNENLENQTFDDNSFDLVITSDVMEHVYNPDKAFKEIYRTLKPGGAHIFSVPIINKFKKTQRWAKEGQNGEPIFLFEPEWHGNPVDEKGSPVTMHWGFDIVDFIKKESGADSWIEYYYDLEHGISGEYIEIVVQKKKYKK